MRQTGIDDTELRQFLEEVQMPVQDAAWRQKLSERNDRYAALRELFEEALAAAPDEGNATLGALGVTALDVQATFDSLAMGYHYPDL